MLIPMPFFLSRESRTTCGLGSALMALSAVMLLPFFAAGAGHADNEADAVVAQVNGQPIRMSELHRRLLVDYGKTVLDQLVNESIVAQEAQRLGIAITEQDIEAGLQDYISKLPVGTSLDRSLREQGLGLASLREQLRTVLRLRRMVEAKVQPNDREIDDRIKTVVRFLENPDQYRVSVLFSKEKSKALRIMEALRQGHDFAEVARAQSEEASSAFGGDVGWRDASEMASFCENLKQMRILNFKLEKNQISDLVETEEGCRIFKITDFRRGKRLSDKEARERAKQLLVEERLMGEMNQKLSQLRQLAQVVKSPPFDK